MLIIPKFFVPLHALIYDAYDEHNEHIARSAASLP